MRRLVAIAFAVALVACSSNKPKTGGESTTSSSTTTTTAASGAVAPTAYVESGDYVNGRHIGLIKTVSADHTVDIDIVQFLTGDAAITAYKQDTGSSEPPDNDYYVRNQNKLVRHLTLAPDAVFRVQALGQANVTAGNPNEGHEVSFEEFAGYWTGSKHEQAINTLFWITLKDGAIATVEEQFVP